MSSIKTDFKLVLAFAGIAIIWGTTYLGISIAVKTIPGWYVASIRQIIAATILLIYLIKTNSLKWVSPSYFFRQFLLAVFLIVIANGFTTLAEKTVPSGLAALINSASPLLVFVGSAVLGYQKPTWVGFLGIVLGMIGVVFLFRDGVSGLLIPEYRSGIILLGMAITGWAIGTIYSKKNTALSQGIFHDLFYQFSIAGILQFFLALQFSGKADVASWSTESMLATVYLAVFGSIGGFFCYNYALKRRSASDVSIVTYFNTIIALFLGWFLLDETITSDIVIASILIIGGVVVTNFPNYIKKKNVSAG